MVFSLLPRNTIALPILPLPILLTLFFFRSQATDGLFFAPTEHHRPAHLALADLAHALLLSQSSHRWSFLCSHGTPSPCPSCPCRSCSRSSSFAVKPPMVFSLLPRNTIALPILPL